MFKKTLFCIIFINILLFSKVSFSYFDPLKCGNFIQKKSKIEGFDLKKEAMSCAWDILKNGGGERLFKICFKTEVLKKVKDEEKSNRITDKTWKIVKKSCT